MKGQYGSSHHTFCDFFWRTSLLENRLNSDIYGKLWFKWGGYGSRYSYGEYDSIVDDTDWNNYFVSIMPTSNVFTMLE